jgi:hypothetical protein
MNLDELWSQVKIDGTLDAKSFVENVLFSGDDSYLREIRDDFKQKFIDPFSKNLKSIKDKDIKKIFDPLNLSDLADDNFKNDLLKFKKKIKAFIKIKLPDEKETEKGVLETVKSTKTGSVLPQEPKKESEETQQPNMFQKLLLKLKDNSLNFLQGLIEKFTGKQQGGEQKNIGPEIPEFNFSDDAKNYLKHLVLIDFLDKLVEKLLNQKKTPEENKGSGIWGLLGTAALALIPAIISNIIKFLKTLNDFKNTILGLPAVIEKFFEESKLVKWVSSKWTKFIEFVKDIIKFDELKVAFNAKFAEFVSSAKKFLKFDEFYDAIKPIREFSSNVITTFENMFKSGEEIVMGFGKLFSGEGKLATFVKFIIKPFQILGDVIGTTGQFVSKTFGYLGEGFKLLETFFPFFFKMFRVFDKFLGPIALLIDTFIDAFKTLFDLWGDDTLTPIQKGIAVVVSAVVGLGDIFTMIGDLLAKGITGLWNLLTGKGWKTENAASEWLEKNLYQGKGSLGAGAGAATAQAFRMSNNPSAKELIVNGESKPETTNKKENNQKVEPKPQKEIRTFKKPIMPDTEFYEDNVTPNFIPLNNKVRNFTPKPPAPEVKNNEVLNNSVIDLKTVMKDVHKSILDLNKNMLAKNEEQKPVSVTNNNITNNNSGSNNKEYLMGDTRDAISNNRSSWWSQSERVRATI